MALYYRCPRCQALMKIDSKRKFQECKYCGTLCTEDEAKAKIEELGSDEAWDLYYSNEFGGVFEDPQPTAGLAQLSGAPRNLAAKRMVGMEKRGQRSAQNATETGQFATETGEDKTSRTATQTRVDKSAQLEAELRKEVEEALVEEKEDSLTRVLRAILVLIVLAIYVFLYFISHF